MSAPLLVLTGPATPKAAAPWMAAAEQAGWRAELRPIARTLAVEIERTSVDVAPPALLAVSSPNAVPALKRLWSVRPDLRLVPHAALGRQVAKKLSEEGVAPAIIVASDPDVADIGIGAFALALAEATETGARILWPRGERTSDLREELVKAGRYVQAPIAYRTTALPDFRPPGRADAVFFASPESATAWLRRDDVPRTTAIAIGPTTYEALAADYARFVKLVRLPGPRPEGLLGALAGLALPRR
ncbi:MAG: uroporphyrinogen-III synthase [Planctomycetota bacterium]